MIWKLSKEAHLQHIIKVDPGIDLLNGRVDLLLEDKTMGL